MRTSQCFAVPVLALFAACATAPREPTAEHPAPVVLPASESFVLHPRDGGEPYRIWVALPLSYARAPSRRYPVVYSLDADVGFAAGAGIIRFLALSEELPEVLMVGIGYGDDMDRWRARRVGDLTPVTVESRPGSGKAERFLEFLASDVLPLVDRRYRTAPDRTLCGYSLGGLFGTYVLFHRPGLFRRYLIGSPSYLYGGGVALRWPEGIRGEGARPSGIVATSVGKAPAARPSASPGRDRRDARGGRLGRPGKRSEGGLLDITTGGVQRRQLTMCTRAQPGGARVLSSRMAGPASETSASRSRTTLCVGAELAIALRQVLHEPRPSYLRPARESCLQEPLRMTGYRLPRASVHVTEVRSLLQVGVDLIARETPGDILELHDKLLS